MSGPLQGFGQLWQKTFRVPLEGVELSPQELVATWKAPSRRSGRRTRSSTRRWPASRPARSRCSTSARCPGLPVKLSTGILVIYADDESFTFMTPQGHTLSAWITFSASEVDGVTVAQAQALERTSDPFDELAYKLGGSRMNNRFWERTLENLARHVGVTRARRRDQGRLHRPPPAVAPGTERPLQRDVPDDAPDADRAVPAPDQPPLVLSARPSGPYPGRGAPGGTARGRASATRRWRARPSGAGAAGCRRSAARAPRPPTS